MSKAERSARKAGYRSIFERDTAQFLKRCEVPFEYEKQTYQYEIPARKAKYTPDFYLIEQDILIETKGLFSPKDRKKHILMKEQHPHLDIRIVFYNAFAPISKGAKTKHYEWCEKNGIPWAHQKIPRKWLKEGLKKIKGVSK